MDWFRLVAVAGRWLSERTSQPAPPKRQVCGISGAAESARRFHRGGAAAVCGLWSSAVSRPPRAVAGDEYGKVGRGPLEADYL